tara:strand:+ start:40 stop:189 length:150 start_codon:yes stop_codon:yes gene_type:complete
VEEELIRNYFLEIARTEKKRGFFHSFNYLESISTAQSHAKAHVKDVISF